MLPNTNSNQRRDQSEQEAAGVRRHGNDCLYDWLRVARWTQRADNRVSSQWSVDHLRH